VAMAPTIATNALGTSWLLEFEEGGTPFGAQLRRWNDGTQTGADGGVTPLGWSIVSDATASLRSVSNCCLNTAPPGTNAVNAPFRRTYLGIDSAGLPMMAYDLDDSAVFFENGTLQNNNRPAVTRDGASLATDGVTSWVAFRGCDQFPASTGPYTSELWLAPINVSSLNASTMVGLRLSPPGASNCTSMQQLPFDLWLGPPAIAPGAGKLYVAMAIKPSTAGSYAMQLYSRPAGDSSMLGAPLTDANHAAGLNQLPVSMNSATSMAGSSRGPVLVFVEGLGNAATMRATRYNEATSTFVDPLSDSELSSQGGMSGSSTVAPAQLDGLSFSIPSNPAVLTAGRAVYVAWSALSGTSGISGHRIFVAHADVTTQQWVLDSDKRNPDGALNAFPGCDASAPSIALLGGQPTVSWDESCAISGQPYSTNHLLVRRLQ
jgi:hypothetical protein